MKSFKFKCPICGCEDHYQINFVNQFKETKSESGPTYGSSPRFYEVVNRCIINYSLETHYLDGSVGISIGSCANAFLCKNCGYINLFAQNLLSNIKNDETKFKDELSELEKLLESEDITVKQQKEFKEEKEKKTNELKKIRYEIENHEKELEKLDAKIDEAKAKLDSVTIVESVGPKRI